MQYIYFKETLANIKLFTERFNERYESVADQKERLHSAAGPLRKTHVHTLQEIAKVYAAQLCKVRPFNFAGLPPLYTNNKQLAQRLHCSESTVYRHIQRLKYANAITEKVFHGSNSSYELHLNTDLLCLCPRLEAEKLTKKQQEQRKDIELIDSALQNLSSSKCNDTDTDKSNNTLNNKVHKSGAKSKASIPADRSAIAENSYARRKDLCDSENNRTGNTGAHCISAAKSNRSCKSATASGLNSPRAAKPAGRELMLLIDFVARMWLYCRSTLYSRIEFLTISEIEKAKIIFFQMLLSVPEKERENYFYTLMARLYIAGAWLEREPDRYIPIPSKYFDPDNSKGFNITATWLQDQEKRTKFIQKAKADFKTEQISLKAFKQAEQIRQLKAGMKSFFENPSSYESYRKAYQYLNKIDPELANELHKMILEDQKQTA